jgi:hypothetical protein
MTDKLEVVRYLLNTISSLSLRSYPPTNEIFDLKVRLKDIIDSIAAERAPKQDESLPPSHNSDMDAIALFERWLKLSDDIDDVVYVGLLNDTRNIIARLRHTA